LGAGAEASAHGWLAFRQEHLTANLLISGGKERNNGSNQPPLA
jgi:hypothetical protein